MLKFVLSMLLGVVLLSPLHCMTDEELDKVKQMVDQELAKRQTDVFFASPNKLVAKATPTATPTKDPDTKLQNSIDNCINVFGTKKCRILIDDWHMDCDKDEMFKNCEKACGFCGNNINPLVDCKTAKYGCCDDQLISKKDPFGSNCPICKDNDKELCEDHDSDCNEVGLVGEWMRANCKQTCGLCKKPAQKTCQDDPEQAQFCPAWKKEGLCEQLADLMNAHCRKTCGKC